MHVAWALGLNSNKKDSKAFTAGSTTTYSTALLEKVFLQGNMDYSSHVLEGPLEGSLVLKSHWGDAGRGSHLQTHGQGIVKI